MVLQYEITWILFLRVSTLISRGRFFRQRVLLSMNTCLSLDGRNLSTVTWWFWRVCWGVLRQSSADYFSLYWIQAVLQSQTAWLILKDSMVPNFLKQSLRICSFRLLWIFLTKMLARGSLSTCFLYFETLILEFLIFYPFDFSITSSARLASLV